MKNRSIIQKVLLIFLIVNILSCSKDDNKDPEPIASFSFSGDGQPAPSEIIFTNSSTNAESYLWEFGDGSSSTLKSPTHTYTTGGNFTIKLTATGPGGSNALSRAIDILEPTADPVANFSFTGDNNFAPCKVVFQNTSSNSTTFLWDFDDGTNSTNADPNHVFFTGGTYNVTLTAKNAAGINDAINKTVIIKNPPTKLKLTQFTIWEIPWNDPNGGGWDSDSGPDLYYKIYYEGGSTLFTSGYYEDKTIADMPLAFNDGLPYYFPGLDNQVTLSVYDYDGLSTDDFIGGFYFTLRQYMPTNGDLYPSSINLHSETSQLNFTLSVVWEE